MSLFKACLLAVISLAVTLPGAAFSVTIEASRVIRKAKAPSFDFSTDGSARGNVLGAPDDGGKYLDLAYAATGQSFIRLETDQPFGLDGTRKRDLRIFNFSTVAQNNNQAVAIWVKINGTSYNVGNTEIVRDVSKGIAGVWDSPTGRGTTYRERGWVVFGGRKGGKIDLDFFFGTDNPYYRTIPNASMSEITISSYNQNGVTTQNYDLDAVKAFTVAAVPVPPAVWLFGTGLVGLAAVARRRRV